MVGFVWVLSLFFLMMAVWILVIIIVLIDPIHRYAILSMQVVMSLLIFLRIATRMFYIRLVGKVRYYQGDFHY